MSKLTVESIIGIYGNAVKEIKVYHKIKRVAINDFLQADPVAFSLSDEPDVLNIYVDKESRDASIDGKLNRDLAKEGE